MRRIEEEIFVANSKGDVKALGMKINCAPTDLHIYVNGVDITKSVVLEEVRIVIAREQQQSAVVLVSSPQSEGK
jgi:hypothetical protein